MPAARSSFLISIKMLTILVTMMISFVMAQDGTMTQLTTKFPGSRFDTVALYDGDDSVYILGGKTILGKVTEVFKLSLSTEKLEVVANFPESRYGHYGGNAQWDGEGNIWYFEGNGQGPWKFTPAVGQAPAKLIDMNATNHYELSNTPPGYWNKTEKASYLFGGIRRGTKSQKMCKYLEFNNTVVLLPVTGTEYLFQALQSSVWDEARNTAYLMSINFGSAYISSFVSSFDPNTFQFTDMDIRLPIWVQASAPVWDGTNIYMIGGFNSSHEFIKFNPVTKEVRVLNVPDFPPKLYSASAVYVEKLKRIYVFGGAQLVGRYGLFRDSIFYVSLGKNIGRKVEIEQKEEFAEKVEETKMNPSTKSTTIETSNDAKSETAHNSAGFPLQVLGSFLVLIAAISTMIV